MTEIRPDEAARPDESPTDDSRAVERFRFLSEAGPVLSSSLDFEATFQAVARLAVPRFADWCTVDVVEGEPTVRRVAVVHAEPEKEAIARELGERFPPPAGSPQPAGEAMRTGEPKFLPHVDDSVLDERTLGSEHRRLLEELDTRSVIAAPLIARDRVLGAITFVRGENRPPYEEEDLALLRELADRAALAIDNARLFQDASEAHERLSHVLHSITDIFFGVDEEWRFTFLNEAAREALARLRGPEPGEADAARDQADAEQDQPNEASVVGQLFWEVVPEVSGTRFESEYRRVMDVREPAHFEGYFEPWDRWYETHVYPATRGLTAYMRDVTERRRAEEDRERLLNELHFERSRLRTIFQKSPAFIAVTRGPDHLFEMANGRYRRLIGDREVVGSTVREVFPELEGEKYFDLLDRVYETGEPYHGEEERLELRREPGGALEEVYLDFVYQALEEVDGSVSGILHHGYEVTDQVRARKQLEEQREAVEKAEARSAFLAEASRILASSLDYQETLRNVASLAVPREADWCAVDIVDEEGEIHRVAVEHADPDRVAFVRELQERYPPDPDAEEGTVEVIRTGEPHLVPEIPDELLERGAQDEEHLELLRRLELRSYVSAPLITRGRTLGAITLVWAESDRRYGEADLEFVRELADRAAVAVDNARLFREAETARERAEQRAAEEKALRRAAEAVGAGYTVEEVTARIAGSAVRATGADGVTVERLVQDGGEVETVAGEGKHTLPIGIRIPYEGSLAQATLQAGEPLVVERLADSDRTVSDELLRACGDCQAISVPLIEGGAPLGILILLRGAGHPPFSDEEVERARTFGGLAGLAFRKAQLLEESERGREEVQRVLESRSRLMRGFTHDVKNPIGAAQSHARLLEEEIVGGLTSKQQDSVERIRRSLDSALALIDDVFELARAEAGELRIESAPVDLREVTGEVVEEHRLRAESRDLSLSWSAPDELPVVVTDEGRFRQVLENLLANAIKFTEEGGVQVPIDVRSRDGRRWVAVAVEDTGPGIPREEQKRLFQEFSRVGSGDAPGTGLGLAISQRIADLLNAEITVESTPEVGSTFTLWIPVAEDATGSSRMVG